MRSWDVFLLDLRVHSVQGVTRQAAMVLALQYLGLVHEDGVDVRPAVTS